MGSLNTLDIPPAALTWCFQGESMAFKSWSSASREWSRSSTHPQLRPPWHLGSSIMISLLASLMTGNDVGTLGKHSTPSYLSLKFFYTVDQSLILPFLLKAVECKCASVHHHPSLFGGLFSISPQWCFPAVTLPCFIKHLWFDLNIYTPTFQRQRYPHVGPTNIKRYQRNSAFHTSLSMHEPILPWLFILF